MNNSLVGLEFITSTRAAKVPSSPPQRRCISTDSINEAGDDCTFCVRCQHGGSDVQVLGCGCLFHARCLQLDAPLTHCPNCNAETTGLVLQPMDFREIDEARKLSLDARGKSNNRRGRKRKSSVISESDGLDSNSSSGNLNESLHSTALPPVPSSSNKKSSLDEFKEKSTGNCRTGRWTSEEMKFCDQLITSFKDGQFPLAKGVKLNDFLSSMLKSKQSRLTKKMKNAKLSSKTFTPGSCHIPTVQECKDFSVLEENFVFAIQDAMESAELKFHMRKEWREMLCSHCLVLGQPLDADAWLSSVEEMEKRSANARESSFLQRRKLMMGYALSQDSQRAEAGVFIEKTPSEMTAAQSNEPLKAHTSDVAFNASETYEFLQLLNDDVPEVNDFSQINQVSDIMQDFHTDNHGKSGVLHSSPFLNRISSYMKRHNVPFEHVDVWVPSPSQDNMGAPKFRLNFAGSATVDSKAPASGKAQLEALGQEDHFNLLAFGDYSQKFSFANGCGLPGRVYQTGIPSWEENVQNAPDTHFERCGGASQWGIKTVLGFPVASPNAGRVVILLYSIHDRKRDDNMVSKLMEEFSKLMPTPKWKLVVDVASPLDEVSPGISCPGIQGAISGIGSNPVSSVNNSSQTDQRIQDIITLLDGEMSPNIDQQTQNFTSLRLFLLKSKRTSKDDEVISILLRSYASYCGSGRSKNDVANMIANEYAFLNTSHQPQSMQLDYHHHMTPQAASHSSAQSSVAQMNHQPQHTPQTTEYGHSVFSQMPIQQHQQPITMKPPIFDNTRVSSQQQNGPQTTQTNTNYNDVSLSSFLDPSISFFSLPVDADFSERPDSPTLTPIVSNTTGADNLSIVSN